MKIWMNGSVMEDKEAAVSIYDHGFLYGIGLFETFRTYSGVPYLLEDHLARLREGCAQLSMKWSYNAQYLREQIAGLLEANGLTDAYIRLSVSAGPDILGLPSGEYSWPNVILYMKELPPIQREIYEEGKPLQMVSIRRNSPEGPVRFKSFHYMNNLLAKRELGGYPWAAGAEGLFVNERGFLAEGIVSNLFFVKAGRLYTPSIHTGILPGITRKKVIEIARQTGVEADEGLYSWDELVSADECFLTNSVQELVPVKKMFNESGHSFLPALESPGPLTASLAGLYKSSIDNYCSKGRLEDERHNK